jgi:predicted dehydrogenase
MAWFYAGFGTDAVDLFQVVGSKGSIVLHKAYRFDIARKLTVQRKAQLEITDFAKTDNFSGMISYFADCIQKGVAPLADGAEGLADMAAMIAIEAAGKTHTVQ